MGYAFLPENIMQSWPRLSPAAKAVAGALASFMNKEGKCWPRRATLAKQAGLGRLKSVTKATHELEELGLLCIDRRRRASAVYSWADQDPAVSAPSSPNQGRADSALSRKQETADTAPSRNQDPAVGASSKRQERADGAPSKNQERAVNAFQERAVRAPQKSLQEESTTTPPPKPSPPAETPDLALDVSLPTAVGGFFKNHRNGNSNGNGISDETVRAFSGMVNDAIKQHGSEPVEKALQVLARDLPAKPDAIARYFSPILKRHIASHQREVARQQAWDENEKARQDREKRLEAARRDAATRPDRFAKWRKPDKDQEGPQDAPQDERRDKLREQARMLQEGSG